MGPYSEEFKRFVQEHEADDTTHLLLSSHKWPHIDVKLAASCIESRRKLADKCPEWTSPDIFCPSELSAQQCSSSLAANHKAKKILEFFKATGGVGKPAIADLTSGLGVDCASFCRTGSRVLYNDINPALCAAAEHNFQSMGLQNVNVRSISIGRETIEGILEEFGPDVVFLDPARRDKDGSKVFHLEACSPNVLEIAPQILQMGKRLVLKLSPMADISSLVHQLQDVCSIHIIQVGQECKEVLVMCYHNNSPCGNPEISVENPILPDSILKYDFASGQSLKAPLMDRLPQAGDILLEPGKALMKCGAWGVMALKWNLQALGTDSHIFLCSQEDIDYSYIGRRLRVLNVAPLNKRSIEQFALEYKVEGVLARSVNIKSEELALRLGKASSKSKIKDKPSARIYALMCAGSERLILACEQY